MSNLTSSISFTMEQSTSDVVLGFGALLISCAAFGSMFAPLKNHSCEDGFFVQWVECSVVLVAGFIINCIRQFPSYEWIAGIGGALYATGNVFSVPIIKGLGMGVGFLIWSSMQILVGWSVARFGFFGWLEPTAVKHEKLNYIGMLLTLLSGVLFIFVNHSDVNGKKSYNVNTGIHSSNEKNVEISAKQNRFVKSSTLRKIPLVMMAMTLAVFHGLMMSPIDVLKQKHPSKDRFKVFDYLWSFYSTVFVFSTVYFMTYCLVRRRKAYVERELVLPSVGYGILWTIGMTFWFLSSDKLSQVVVYPITTRLPPITSALLEVLVYKTIVGRSNVIFLAVVILVGLGGVVLIALSNQTF